VPILRLLLVGLVAGLLATPGVASAAPFGLGTISDQLAATHVAVDPRAGLSAAEIQRLERATAALRADGVPADVVVLREQALGANRFAEEVHRVVRYEGVQVVIVREPLGVGFAAPSVYEFQDEHEELVEAASATLRADPLGTASSLARRGWELSQAEIAAQDRAAEDEDDDDGIGSVLVGLAVLLALGAAVVIAVRRRRRAGGGWSGGAASSRRWGRRVPQPEEPREVLEPLLDDLARRITELAPQVEMPDAAEGARRAYAEAVLAYGEAREALPAVATSRQARAVHDDIERGLGAAELAQRIVDGDDPPGNGRRRPRRRFGAR